MTPAVRRLLEALLAGERLISPRHMGGYKLMPSLRAVRWATYWSARRTGLLGGVASLGVTWADVTERGRRETLGDREA